MPKVLLVEPHADVLSLLEHVVRRLGYEPVVGAGHDAGAPEVDAAVIEPGDRRGLVMARRLRELGRPVVFTSIFPPEQEALELDPVAYFVKPFPLRELERALLEALEPDRPAAA